MDKEVAIIKDWLRMKHCTLWQMWDISDDEGLTAAATWLRDTMNEVVDFYVEYR